MPERITLLQGWWKHIASRTSGPVEGELRMSLHPSSGQHTLILLILHSPTGDKLEANCAPSQTTMRSQERNA
ncbi:hypothetical protein Pmani_008203 [Petrolisthes manimaculis]|uniref:Uncharacterized protein n=1 Tax=Petrolisthes manimaculis TaxID=1843537 RepID=A0AAE1Q6S6_9EUCA|nr:hypothetical protein Pmani_008203 [Petrolisthes manimaculis]